MRYTKSIAFLVATTLTGYVMTSSLKDAIEKSSEKCQAAIEAARKMSQTAEDEQCVTLSKQMVKPSLVAKDKCSEAEFEYIKNVACDMSLITKVTSPMETSTKVTITTSSISKLTDAIATRSEKCQDVFKQGDSLASVPKDKQCLMLSSSQAYAFLVGDDKCSDADLAYILKEGCGMSVTKPASSPITVAVATRPKGCQTAFKQASQISPTPEEKQCAALATPMARGFLIGGDKCSDSDLEYVRNVACSLIGITIPTKPASSPITVAVATRPKGCQIAFKQANELVPTPEDKQCAALASSMARGFLIGADKCSDSDVEYVRNVACSLIGITIPTKPTVPTPSTTNRQKEVMGLNPLSPAVDNLNAECQQSFWSCLKLLPEVRYWVDQRFYCRAMRLHQATFCMVAMGDCREVDLDQLKAATCHGQPESPHVENSGCMKNTSTLAIIFAFLLIVYFVF